MNLKNKTLVKALAVASVISAAVFWLFFTTSIKDQSIQKIPQPLIGTTKKDATQKSQLPISSKDKEQRIRTNEFVENVRKQVEAYSKEGFKGLGKLQKNLLDSDYKKIVKLLGVPDRESSIALELLHEKDLLLLDVIDSRIDGAKRSSTQANSQRVYNIDLELELLVGKENVKKIALWKDTQIDRSLASQFRFRLESQFINLSEQQEQAIVTALYSERKKRAMFDFRSQQEKLQNKIDFVNDVVSRTSTLLDPNQNLELTNYLTDLAKRSSPTRN